jgi:hypothetical protein
MGFHRKRTVNLSAPAKQRDKCQWTRQSSDDDARTHARGRIVENNDERVDNLPIIFLRLGIPDWLRDLDSSNLT